MNELALGFSMRGVGILLVSFTNMGAWLSKPRAMCYPCATRAHFWASRSPNRYLCKALLNKM